MSTASEDRDKLDALLEQCNASLEELSACARNASPGVSQACREEINVLIANRESLRRGLLKFGDSRCLCSSCAGESGQQVQ